MGFSVGVFLSVSLWAEVGYFPPWGKDSNLQYNPPIEITKEPIPPFQKLVENIILFHQKIISPIDGPRSHFRPTSSRYMLLAIRRYGLGRGFLMGCDRLMRENSDPWVYRRIEDNGQLFKYDPP